MGVVLSILMILVSTLVAMSLISTAGYFMTQKVAKQQNEQLIAALYDISDNLKDSQVSPEFQKLVLLMQDKILKLEQDFDNLDFDELSEKAMNELEEINYRINKQREMIELININSYRDKSGGIDLSTIDLENIEDVFINNTQSSDNKNEDDDDEIVSENEQTRESIEFTKSEEYQDETIDEEISESKDNEETSNSKNDED